MSDANLKIEKYFEHYSKEVERVCKVQNLILNDTELQEYDTELLSRLIFPIIEELGFCLLGKNGLENKKKLTSKCIEKVFKDVLEIEDEFVINGLVKCFRHGLLHQTHAKLRHKYEGVEYFFGYACNQTGRKGEIIKKTSSRVYTFYINNLVYEFNSQSVKGKVRRLLEANSENFLFVFNYDKRLVT